MSIKHLSLLFVLVTFIACSQKKKQKADSSDNEYSLVPTKEYTNFEIDSDTKLYMKALYLYTDTATNKEYLTFQNVTKNEILIYDWESKKRIKKVVAEKEGANGVGGFFGYLMNSFDEIYLPNDDYPLICIIDTAGDLKKKFPYQTTINGDILIPARAITILHQPFKIIDGKIYIAQRLNWKYKSQCVEKSPVSVTIDTATGVIKALPMKFPPIITSERYLSGVLDVEVEFSREFNGEEFVYSFLYDENIHIANIAHDSVRTVCAKSRFIKAPEKAKLTDIPTDMKNLCEIAMYGNLIYDKYREVYYRFVYHSEDFNVDEENFFELYAFGRNKFSIIILDKDFQCIGETEFPEGIYSTRGYLIRKDGLYLSTSHYKNPAFSDDILQFERIELSN